MKRVIITGATGAIGIALINECIDNNMEVLVFCRENSIRNSGIPHHPLVSIRYCSLDQLHKIENDTGNKYDYFFHLAWDGTIGNARNDLGLQYRNVQYSLDAVRVAKRFGCRKFIGAGSQAEYGRVEGLLSSKTPVHPENGYGIAKLSAGFMTRELAEQLDIEFNWIRVLSVYGPCDGNGSMVMSTINKLLKGEVPEFTKGEQLWDYLYSGDAAAAFISVAERGIDGKTYVLGSGKARPLSDYIWDIQKTVNPFCKVKLGVIPYDERQVMYLCADIMELTHDTGFTPKIDFVDGIKMILR